MSDSTSRSKYLRSDDVKPGSTAIIKDEAIWVKGEYKGQETSQYCATVDFEGEDRTLKFTKLSRNNMHVIGTDSLAWVGKQVSLTTVDVMVDGKLYKSIVVTPVGDFVQPTAKEETPWDE